MIQKSGGTPEEGEAAGQSGPERVRARLRELRERGLWRECAVLESPPGPRVRVGGREYLHLSSNNYLNLASDPRVIEGAVRAARDRGAGAGAARLITGTGSHTVELERALAEFKSAPAALLFSSGYLANLGLMQALFGRGDVLICDELNHASLIDACRLSRAEVRVYPHGDAEAAGRIARDAPRGAGVAIVTDGVFSMDGDLAPLPELDEIARACGAWLIVDDAHGTGVTGPEGRGAAAHFGIGGEHLIQVVTLSKALGSQGGAVTGPRDVIALLINRARSFIFETALAPAAVGAALAALAVLRDDPKPRMELRRAVEILRRAMGDAGVHIPAGESPILPVITGTNERAVRVSARLRELGYWITPIRPPTVPEGSSRLRVTVMAGHQAGELETFARDLAGVMVSE